MHIQRLSRMQSPASSLGGVRHLLIWRLLQLPWGFNIVSFRDQTMFLLVTVRLLSRLSSFLATASGSREVSSRNLWSWDGICSHCRGQGAPLPLACIISPASVTGIWCFGNTRFNYPSRIAVEACTNPSMYTPSKRCDSSQAVSANAHVIADAVARERYAAASACIQEIRKTLCHPLIAHRSVRTMFEHVFHARCQCCYLFPMLIPLHFLHNKRRLPKSWIPAFKEQSLWWFRSIFRPDGDGQFSDLIETFILLDSLLTLGRKWIFARRCAPTCLLFDFNLHNFGLFLNFDLNLGYF